MTARRPLDAAEKDMADLLRLTLRERKITQEQLADRLGITQGVVWQWVNGRIAVSPEKAPAVAEILGLQAHEISARYTRIVEGTGHAQLKFTTVRASNAPAGAVREHVNAPEYNESRPAIRLLLGAIAAADARGALPDGLASSLALLIDALPQSSH